MKDIVENNNGCCLCEAVKDSITNGNKSLIENRLLFESDHFVVIPSLGPFVEGQVMIVSKKHFMNLRSMKKNVLSDLQSVFEFIKTKTIKSFSNSLLFAEHGAYNLIQKGGACVIHMHIHCIPGYNDGINALKRQLKIIYSGYDLLELWRIDKPYILVINSIDNKMYIFEAENVPSQMIRKTLLASRGIVTNWNWRANFDYDMINKTINNWISR
jgi:diadenosine tetraphosphate (Ap4A) HIT family hydrolase